MAEILHEGDINPHAWVGEAKLRARMAFRQMMRAKFDENQTKFDCWQHIREQWLHIEHRLNMLLDRWALRGEQALIELNENHPDWSELRSIQLYIRAASIYEQKPEPDSDLELAAIFWIAAAESWHQYWQTPTARARWAWIVQAFQLEDDAKDAEQEAGFEYEEEEPESPHWEKPSVPIPVPELPPAIPDNYALNQLLRFFRKLRI